MSEAGAESAFLFLIWDAVFQLLALLLAGGLLGLFATHYLKKRDEVTRVAGVILEKRINSEREILRFFENATYSLQVPSEQSDTLNKLMMAHHIESPWGHALQYAEIFGSLDHFHEFQQELEELNSSHKLWLDDKVRFQLNLIQGYIACINRSLVFLQEIEVPRGKPLTSEEYNRAVGVFLLIQGIALDVEFKNLIVELETLMVDSIYHLNLRRSRSSVMRNSFENKVSQKLKERLFGETLLMRLRENFGALAVNLADRACEVPSEVGGFED
mgnify:CR=1 FL=1